MTKYINPYTDFGFKKLFGEEGSKDILTDFLNSLLPEKHQIAELSFKNKEQHSDNGDTRKSFFDIYCTAKNGEKFIVEMQRSEMSFFKDRTLYYLTYPIRDDAKKGGEWNFYLNPVYFIGVLNFMYDSPEEAEVIRYVELKDHKNKTFYDKLGIIYLQMPAFKKNENELTTHIDKWLYFLKNLEDFNDIPAILNEPVFQHAFQVAEYAKLTTEQQRNYDELRLDYLEELEVNRFKLEKAEAKGREEGKTEGKEERTTEIAKNLKAMGVDTHSIVKATGLTEQEIAAL